MFLPLSFTEFKKMMQEGIDKLLQLNENPEMQEMVIIENNKNQIKFNDDKTQENTSGDQ